MALETAGKAQIVALDKTGTITNGEPVVTDVFAAEGITETELLISAYSLEARSEHPLAKAVIAYAIELGYENKNVTEFEALPGNGLRAKLNDEPVAGGNYKFIAEHLKNSEIVEM